MKLGINENYANEFYKKHGVTFNREFQGLNITKFHYNEMSRILKEHNIKYFAMQYPTLDLNKLKLLYNNQSNIIFVDNTKNFNEALEIHEYEDLFTDTFGFYVAEPFKGEYGHMTILGHKIMADNLADVILKELNVSG